MSDICVHGRWIPRGCDECCEEALELRKRIRLASQEFLEDDDHAVSQLLDLRRQPLRRTKRGAR